MGHLKDLDTAHTAERRYVDKKFIYLVWTPVTSAKDRRDVERADPGLGGVAFQRIATAVRAGSLRFSTASRSAGPRKGVRHRRLTPTGRAATAPRDWALV